MKRSFMGFEDNCNVTVSTFKTYIYTVVFGTVPM